MDHIIQIDNTFIEQNTTFSDLIMQLRSGFASNSIIVPMRHHHDFPNSEAGSDSTLLLMPAWNPSKEAGVKIVTVNPRNVQFNLPSIQGTYIYLDATKGIIKAILDAKSLTVKRTAAASALASSFLSREDSNSLLMIGTGALSPNLIRAHASVRPIKKVFVWGRNIDKARTICYELSNEKFLIEPVEKIKDIISEVDIVSCATLSKSPLIEGSLLRNGQHIDLVGAYRTDMREADNDTMKRASIYLDTFQGGLKESGDIVIPLNENVIRKDQIKADLFDLCSNKNPGRTTDHEITVFKSVGHALEDLVAANYYYKRFRNE